MTQINVITKIRIFMASKTLTCTRNYSLKYLKYALKTNFP